MVLLRNRSLRAFLLLVVAAGLAVPFAYGAGSGPNKKAKLTEREKAIHVLNRLGFGPRPGDVDRVLAMGVRNYIEEQLAPERLPDPAVAESLEQFPTLSMTNAQLFDNYEKPLREARRQAQQEMQAAGSGRTAGSSVDVEEKVVERVRRMVPLEKRPQRVLEELAQARIVRAVESQRQLNEVLVDFWMNHFNVFAGKGLDRILLTSFERDVIRPHIWGKFEDLLMATARSPAMLFYLDNAQSVADEAHRAPRPLPRRRGLLALLGMGSAVRPNPPAGLNENYARELMELHTLGVDGGYTQKDVTELARVFTGWSIERPEQGPAFIFRAPLHDVAAKTVLGISFPAGGGLGEGEMMIRVLAHHPATARRIAFKLCQRFIADNPPKKLVDRVAMRFLQTGGDLRETVRAVVLSPEFFDGRYYRARIKSPFDYVVSAVRALGGASDNALPIARQLAQMGEPLYLCQPPTGYSENDQAWVNTGALVARMNFALQLAANRLPGTWADVASLIPAGSARDARKAVDALSCALVDDELSLETKSGLEKRINASNGAATAPLVAGLILGSPEFQKQ
jgi:uncharacterized protein (DUF1800 family)